MSEQKKARFEKIRFITFTLLISLGIALTAGYIIWRFTRDSTEITLELDGWITIGTLTEKPLEGLELTYQKAPIRNVIKISWSIINTGTKGISKFETYPSLIYPGGLVPQAEISETSPLLQINKKLLIDSINTTIKVSNMGIFNPGDFFRVDVYLIDIPDTLVLIDYLKNWDLKAKAVDLSIIKNVVPELPLQSQEAARKKRLEFIQSVIIPIIMVIPLIVMVLSFVNLYRKKKS